LPTIVSLNGDDGTCPTAVIPLVANPRVRGSHARRRVTASRIMGYVGSQKKNGVRHLVDFSRPTHRNETHSFSPHGGIADERNVLTTR
jgi:hypothetical protein